MIPTSVTNSPPPAGLAQNGASVSVLGAAAGVGGGLGITINGPGTLTAGNGAGGGAAAATAQNNYNSIVLGLASLILEGRPISDDEYQHQVGKGAGGSNGATVTSSGSTGSGRLSPRPSTSRAAINITTNPYNPRLSYNGLGAGGGGTSSSSNSSSNNTTTHQRWTQKLCQLRQVSPAAQSMSMEPELVALAINDVATEHGGVGGGGGGTGGSSGEFEIVRRVLLNRAGLGGGGGLGAVGSGGGGTNNSSAASSPGSNSSDNILHSLQSLATTCLRGGSGPTASNNLNLPLPMPMPMSMAMPLPQFGETRPFSLDFNYIPPSRSTITAAAASSNSPSIATATATTTTTASTTTATNSRPKHGPHCDQFLRKMGLAKGQDSANDNEEHFCDMSYVNITCSRWRAYCLKMDAILARREPGICIEVYLGPVSHKILLEQWIITSKEKVPPPTMTLPSLCSAIRSQLYFSQIVAWCDLLRKCDPSVYDSGRVIFANGNGNNAGDLATTTTASSGTTSSPSQSSSSSSTRRPRLNIFYRIKQHDPNGGGGAGGGGAAGLDGAFNAKANVHNFPYVNIAENISISVCVKSLPRINGGLPQVGPVLVAPQRMLRAACTPTNGGGFQAATPTGLGARIAIVGASPGNGLARANCDKNKANSPPKQMVELLAEEEDDQLGRDDLDGSGGSLSHRERQLQKYRKRMQRRDKKRERKSSLERQPMEQEPEDLEPEQEPMEEEAQAMVMTLAQPRRIAMISTGTQTSLSSCQQCGREKTLLCLNCSNGEDDHSDVENGQTENDNEDTGGSGSEMEDISSCSLSSGDLIVGTPRNNAELLLQAIQRTPKNRQSRDLNRGSRAAAGAARNNNQPKAAASTGGCQLCKRQKTQHHFAQAKQEQIKQETTPIPTNGGHQMEEEEGEQQSIASTKLTPNIERCSLNAITERCQTPPLPLESTNNLVGQFKTPQLKLDTHSPLPMPTLLTLARPMPTKPSQLRLNCSGSGLPQMYDNETPPPTTSPLLRKALPKVNLTTIFCSSAPITIGSGSSSTSQASSSSLAFCFDPSTLSHAQSQLIPSDLGNNLTVQKSFSAPTLPNVSNSSSSSTLSISPRFAKQAAAASFYKRRSRHLSDRSDRSSLGSDEQLSDEDLESAGMFSPAGSPMKCRSRLASQFAHRPLLGNLEESLLQRRLMPKIEVQGFKLLLGASGGFCPTQLTIPAASYFYELPGETLSTPYMCEIRMPRKGYSVPRTGTLQATLLNPMGTVVRMFVIPYDMRDMPPLHRTFIRQRILAEEANPCLQQQQQQQQQEKEQVQPRSPTTTSTTSKLGHFITAEQMKRLRYSIHLRFQTSRSGRLSLHTDIRLLISRRTDCDTAAAHAKGVLEAPNELITDTLMPQEPRYSSRQESSSASSKI